MRNERDDDDIIDNEELSFDFNFDLKEDFYNPSNSYESDCGYFPGLKTSKIEFLYPDEKEKNNYDFYLSKGYRRYSGFFYRTICKDCNECIPLRVLVPEFKLSRSQKRTLRKNKDITILVNNLPNITNEKLKLYIKYKENKHPDNKFHIYYEELSGYYGNFEFTHEIIYFINNKIVAVSIIDETPISLSSVYCYYDTDFLDRRLGILSALYEIAYAKKLGKQFYYLGFYIENTNKMLYKKFFRPNQIYVNEKWVDFLTK